jgi:trans-2,3-dihydro-3-hydroxyanthranilate isomerase
MDYQLWDVFTERALSGNPLAVVPDAAALSGAQMQAIAREFNLSETSFVLPSKQADAKARYFTPALELPMAGHPSIGTVYALEYLGRIAKETLGLELGVGVVPMRLERNGGRLRRVWMNQGVPELLEVEGDRARVAKGLGLEEDDLDPELPIQLASAGVPFLYVPVRESAALARARLGEASLASLTEDGPKGVFVFTRRAEEADARARMFGQAVGVGEDPATGSAHGPLGAYLASYGMLDFDGDSAAFLSRQGIEMGRPSEIYVRVHKSPAGFKVEVGGAAVLVGEGRLYL